MAAAMTGRQAGPMSLPPPTDRVPRSLVTLFDRLREGGLARDTSLKWILGVCSGIAARVGVDPIVVRLVFLVLVLLGGFGLLPYLIAAILLPDEKGTIHLEEAFRQRRGQSLWIVVLVAAVIGGEISDHRAVAALALVAFTVWWVASGRDGRDGDGLSRVDHDSKSGGSLSPQDAPRPPSPWAPASTPAVSHGLGPGRTDLPLAAAAPMAPTLAESPPRRPTLGGFRTLVVIGSVASAYAVGVKLAPAVAPGRSPIDLGVVGAVGVLGLALVTVGILGRRAPGLAIIALVGAVAVGAGGLLPESLRPAGGVTSIGEQTWAPARTDPASVSYSLGAGSATLDLSAIRAGDPPRVIDVALSAGEMKVVVPADLTVRIEGRLGLGEVSRLAAVTDTSGTVLVDGADLPFAYLVRPAGTSTGGPDVIVRARLTLVSLNIVPTPSATISPALAADPRTTP